MLNSDEKFYLSRRFFISLKEFSDEKFYKDLKMYPVLEEIPDDVVVQAAYDGLRKHAKKISDAHYRSVCARRKYFIEEGIEYLDKLEAEYKEYIENRKKEREKYLKENGYI